MAQKGWEPEADYRNPRKACRYYVVVLLNYRAVFGLGFLRFLCPDCLVCLGHSYVRFQMDSGKHPVAIRPAVAPNGRECRYQVPEELLALAQWASIDSHRKNYSSPLAVALYCWAFVTGFHLGQILAGNLPKSFDLDLQAPVD